MDFLTLLLIAGSFAGCFHNTVSGVLLEIFHWTMEKEGKIRDSVILKPLLQLSDMKMLGFFVLFFLFLFVLAAQNVSFINNNILERL